MIVNADAQAIPLCSGTVGLVCQRLGRRFIGLELKPDYCQMAYKRTAQMGLV